MKIHSGVDAGTGYVHTITATAANTHDIVETHRLVREDDHTVYADSGYLGIEKRDEIKNDEHLSQVEYHIAARPSQNRLTNRYNGFNWATGTRKLSTTSLLFAAKWSTPSIS